MRVATIIAGLREDPKTMRRLEKKADIEKIGLEVVVINYLKKVVQPQRQDVFFMNRRRKKT